MEEWRIVVARNPHWYDEFTAGPQAYGYGFHHSGPQVAEYFHVDEEIAPAPVFLPEERATESVGTVGKLPVLGYAAGVRFEDDAAVARLGRLYRDDIIGVFADPEIAVFPTDCSGASIGNWQDVNRLIDVPALRAANLDGTGVFIAVVDGGIDGTALNAYGIALATLIDRAYTYPSGYAPGTAGPGHGTMVAFDALLAAPNARLLDFAMFRGLGTHPTVPLRLHHALAAYGTLMIMMAQSRPPGALVVTNSWGIPDRSTDKPIGDPMNYCENAEHPFNLQLRALIRVGVDVVFAAGNCGAECPDPKCGAGDTGSGRSIHGANALHDVVTVAGVTTRGDRVGYSSQGPGILDSEKPDVACYTQFDGSAWNGGPDVGTSAAAPIVAGVIAALRQGYPTVSPALMKSTLRNTASGAPVWNPDVGTGIIHAGRALDALRRGAAS
jgi:subtilisin family serine protease